MPRFRIFTAVLLFVLLASSAFAATPKSPSEFLGFPVGADRQLADYHQIVSYFQYLAANSPRVQVEDLGPTTRNNDLILVAISSDENLKNKARYQEIARQLHDPRGLTPAQIEQLTNEGKAIVLVTCNIHSTEIGSTQMAMEWAYALATAQDEETQRRLANVILLLAPSINPDGQLMVVDWYRKNLGTKYEGGAMPWLYHDYTGHDNNRDWYMLTQKETQAVTRAVYQEWFPQIWLDEHQMGYTGPRIFTPPYADPVDADIHPMVWRGANLIGTTMSFRLEQAGKSGVIYGFSYDAYWPGATDGTAWWKNIVGLLTEVASTRMGTPVYIPSEELSGSRKGLVEYGRQINYPNPWPGGWWRLRDIMDYERIASDALLETAADHRADFLSAAVRMAQDAIAKGKPGEYWRIAREQRDPQAAARLAHLMAAQNVEVLVSSDSYLIPTAQPFGPFAGEMLGTQRYPRVKAVPGKDFLPPYDVTTWSLPLMMGVTVEKVTLPASASLRPLSDKDWPGGEKPAPGKPPKPVRLGMYKAWLPNMDEGWTRFVLEQRGYKPAALDNKALAAGKLRDRFDAIILPDAPKEAMLEGKWRWDPESPLKYWEELPPDYAGGMGKDGVQALKEFVAQGGTLIALGRATELVLDEFNVPVMNTLAKAKREDFLCPGSLLRVSYDTSHPVAAGMPSEGVVFVDAPIAFRTVLPGADVERAAIAQYPAEEEDVLVSGWIRGAENLTRHAAAVALRTGKGRIVLFGFRPQFRAQTEATFPLLFNAIQWSVADAAPASGH